MARVTLDFDSAQVQRALRRIAGRGAPRAAADVLNKVAFEIRDAEHKHIGQIFDFSGTSTKKFLQRSVFFDKATLSKPTVEIYPLPGSRALLEEQAEGGTVTADGDNERLSLGDKLAVPVKRNIKRSSRGRVRKSMTPGALLSQGRAFISTDGKTIFQRLRGDRIRVLYILVDRAQLEPVFEFFRVAEQTARRELPKKARRVLEKATGR